MELRILSIYDIDKQELESVKLRGKTLTKKIPTDNTDNINNNLTIMR